MWKKNNLFKFLGKFGEINLNWDSGRVGFPALETRMFFGEFPGLVEGFPAKMKLRLI